MAVTAPIAPVDDSRNDQMRSPTAMVAW